MRTNSLLLLVIRAGVSAAGGEPDQVDGFCDSPDGSSFRIRFMPSELGRPVENVTVAGPGGPYTWTRSDDPNAVHVIREIDQHAMQRDLFDTMKDKPIRLIGVPAP